MRETIMHEKIASMATGISYTVAGGTYMIGEFTVNEVAAICGIFLAFATFVVSWIYKHKHYKLAKAEAEKDEHEPL